MAEKGEKEKELRGGAQSGLDSVPLIFLADLRPCAPPLQLLLLLFTVLDTTYSERIATGSRGISLKASGDVGSLSRVTSSNPCRCRDGTFLNTALERVKVCASLPGSVGAIGGRADRERAPPCKQCRCSRCIALTVFRQTIHCTILWRKKTFTVCHALRRSCDWSKIIDKVVQRDERCRSTILYV